jgi:hypothetical protein
MARHCISAAVIVAAGAIVLTAPALAQGVTGPSGATGMVRIGSILAQPKRTVPGVGTIYTPESSIAKPADRGLRAHTHHEILVPNAPVQPPQPQLGVAPHAAPRITLTETPASLACIYRLVPSSFGCDPRKASRVVGGGTKAIAIVDAFHNPTARADLKKFSSFFGLPQADLRVYYCNAVTCSGVTTPPPQDAGWALEIALDIQYAHAMAPHARIILVEAFSNSFVDLQRAVNRAADWVQAAGGGQISNSYGASEFTGQTAFDAQWIRDGVVFFASTGDAPGAEYPSTNPNVVAVGGTRINRSGSGLFVNETAWTETGGGLSSVYSRPSYQRVISSRVGSHRGVPDIAADADPESGVYVYCSAASCGFASPWVVVGGTSLASPVIAGIANNSGNFRTSSQLELTSIYNDLGGPRYFDIRAGQCGNGPNGMKSSAIAGWDRCTGVGTPKGKKGL